MDCRGCAEEEKWLSCRCCSLEMLAPAQLLYTTLKRHPTGSWTVIPVFLPLVWTQPAQEKRSALA